MCYSYTLIDRERSTVSPPGERAGLYTRWHQPWQSPSTAGTRRRLHAVAPVTALHMFVFLLVLKRRIELCCLVINRRIELCCSLATIELCCVLCSGRSLYICIYIHNIYIY